jgi:hypothetical protein
MAMQIKLDAGTLLGFKIVATGESAVILHSPKTGAKGCPAIGKDAGLDAASQSSGENGRERR